MQDNNMNDKIVNVKLPGEKQATISLVLGIISVILLFFTGFSIIAAILGVIGVIFATKSKKLGFKSAVRTAGFVLSLIGLVLGVLIFAVVMAYYVGLFTF